MREPRHRIPDRQMKSDRSSFIMIAASLALIGLIFALTLKGGALAGFVTGGSHAGPAAIRAGADLSHIPLLALPVLVWAAVP